MIRYANFQLYMASSAEIIWKNPTNQDKYINKREQLFYTSNDMSPE